MARAYIIGVHGSGKSTLIEKLAESYPQKFVKSKKLDIPKVDCPISRSLIRHCRYFLQTFFVSALEAANPDKIVLCDRSFIDNLAYTSAYRELGWISNHEFGRYSLLDESLFPNHSMPDGSKPDFIFVNPPIDFIKDRLSERWLKEGKKWNEENFDYLKRVHEAYNFIFANAKDYLPSGSNHLVLTKTNMDQRINETYFWLRKDTDNPAPSIQSVCTVVSQ